MVKNLVQLSSRSLLSVSIILSMHGWAEDVGQFKIEELTVTAQKRSESISRVGLAVTALTGSSLEEQGISDVVDLTLVTPSLTYAATNTGSPVYTMRGVGFYESSLAAYPAVTVYVDEVPLMFPALTGTSQIDLERVEVMKGPQGILFGQNATGGAINYVARKPTDEFEAGIKLTYGRFSDTRAEGFISGPVTDNMSARLAVKAEHADDWQYSYTRDDSTGEKEKYNARLLVDWQATDDLALEFGVNGWVDRSDPQAPQLIGFALASAGGVPVSPNGDKIVAYPLSPEDSRAADWSPNNRPDGDKSMGQVSLRTIYDISDNLSLTAITAYSKYRRREVSDQDGVTFNTIDFRRADGDIKSFSQELRIANAGDNNTRWLVGVNYDKSTVDEFFGYFYPDSSVTDLLKGVAASFGVDASFWNSNSFFSDQELENYAAFANVEYDFSDEFTVKIGARFTENERTSESCNIDDDLGGEAVLFNFLYGLPRPGVPEIERGGCVTSFQTPDGRVPVDVFRGELKEDNVSWRIGIDYKPTDETLFYANISKGYKAGSFPTAAATDVVQYKAVTQESIQSYEVGIKTRPLGSLLSIDASAFFYDYQDKQLRTLFNDPVFGDLNNLSNVPESEVMGFEFNVNLYPTDGLSLSAQVAYLDTEVNEYIGYNPAVTPKENDNFDFSGSSVPYTPEWTAAGTANYEFPVGDGLTANVGATVSYNSDTSSLIGGALIDEIDSYTLVDLRAGIRSYDDRWGVQAWGKNVTGTDYATNVIHIFDTIVRYTGDPATYGITLNYNF